MNDKIFCYTCDTSLTETDNSLEGAVWGNRFVRAEHLAMHKQQAIESIDRVIALCSQQSDDLSKRILEELEKAKEDLDPIVMTESSRLG